MKCEIPPSPTDGFLAILNEKGNSEIVEYFPNIIILASKKNFKIKG